MKKLRNILIAMAFLLGIMISTQVSAAFEIFDGDEVLENGRFKPHSINGEGTFYCIQGHGSFNATLSRSRLGSFYPGYTLRSWCSHCGNNDPWNGNSYTTIAYKQASRYDERNYQDVAYVVYNGGHSMEAAYALWALDINRQNGGAMEPDNALSLAGKAYNNFYQSIHVNYVDVFKDLIRDNTTGSNLKVSVNRTDKTYTVGPFNVSYPLGNYDGINKWSWIETIKLYDQNNKEITGIQIINSSGKLVYDTDKDGNLRNVPKNNENFYVRFKTDGTVRDVYLDVSFGYLESHSAELYKYQGTYYTWSWKKKRLSSDHKHGRYCYTNGQGKHKHGYKYIRTAYQNYLAKNASGSAQTLLSVRSVSPNYKTTNIRMPFAINNANPSKRPEKPNEPDKPLIDITMNISGKVFLDQDQGKVNEGNNVLDNGEALAGVEVTLYDAETNQMVVNRDTGKNYIALTDSNGYYEFSRVDAQKKYYVKFTYNGMLYTNVAYNYTGDNTSKATEEAQGHSSNRQDFNDVFKEIGSYPSNYKVENDIFGMKYNKVYLQEEVADIFKEVAKKVVELNGDEMAAYHAVAGSSSDKRSKVQFVADCRIRAYTVQTYAMPNEFVIDKFNQVVAGKGYSPVYGGVYNQTNVNLGIKARPTFDLALYKDVFNAVLNINGKTETYIYDARKDWANEGFSFGVKEDDYLNQLRKKYISGQDTNLQTTETIDEGNYNHEYRTEEIINGNNQNTAINDTNLYDENKNYAWRDINHGLVDNDKLQIHVTYKLAIRNQSSIAGAVTEIVDYYDNHYQFEKAYVGDKNGNEIGGTKVETSETSMYGSDTHYSTDEKYKTIYLRPSEQKLTDDDREQYVYVTFGLINPEQTLVEAGLPDGNRFYTYNLAEINGYKTYGTGLIDRDSNPGNFEPATYEMGKTALEDDESRAPTYIYSHRNSRTLEGTVFEDILTSKDANKINTNQTRFGNGTIDDKDTKIEGIKVELVEVKNGQLISRQTTYTDKNGWYGFGAFLPGDYTIRFTYGAEDKTALNKTSQYTQGLNDTSYNGQDYQSTIFEMKQGETVTPHNYKVDATLNNIYTRNNQAKHKEESTVDVADQVITKYETEGYYWFDDVSLANKSDATDDIARRDMVTAYSKSEYGKEIINHKAEVFNAYKNQKTLREAETKDKDFDEFTQAQPMEESLDTKEKNRELVDELERRTYMYAYTPEIPVEVEYTTKQIVGNLATDKYTYKITGVDFGVVERPRAQLTIDQDVKHIKVTASDGTILFDTENGVDNLQWVAKGDLAKYDKNELINIILDDELLSGAKLEIIYNITVTNNSEKGIGTSRAKTIINYVANNLNFDIADNNGLWEVVKKEDIQTVYRSTFINNANRNEKVKFIDLSTQTTVLKTTDTNPLTKPLNSGESATATLVLKKTLSAESSSDDLSYSNMSEIVEIDNTQGRYDQGAIPGNQSLEEQPREHDTSGASRYDETDYDSGTKNVKTRYPQDGKVIVTPPTGSKMIYYVLGITATVILAVGIFIIKKFVLKKK